VTDARRLTGSNEFLAAFAERLVASGVDVAGGTDASAGSAAAATSVGTASRVLRER